MINLTHGVSPSHPTTDRGAYGLRLAGLRADLLVATDATHPMVTISRDVCADPPAPEVGYVGVDRAELAFGDGNALVVDRRDQSVQVITRQALRDDDIAHPLLAFAAAVFSLWLGREALHAGAFLAGGAAWCVIGDKGAGKSSLMAMLAARHVPILADDLVVLAGPTALPGPRCLDLRRDAANRLGMGRELGMVGTRERFRVDLAEAPPSPIGGFIHLGWSPGLHGAEMHRVAWESQIPELFKALPLAAGNEAAYLDLAALPAWRLQRPSDWSVLDSVADLVLGTVTTARR